VGSVGCSEAEGVVEMKERERMSDEGEVRAAADELAIDLRGIARRIAQEQQPVTEVEPKRESASSNDPTVDFGVSLQVREEACEAAMEARKEYPGVFPGVDLYVDAIAPVIAGAAYKAGLLRAREVVEAERDRMKALARKWRTTGVEARALDAALAAIDKEGETSE
jgi:hypothetical protein